VALLQQTALKKSSVDVNILSAWEESSMDKMGDVASGGEERESRASGRPHDDEMTTMPGRVEVAENQKLPSLKRDASGNYKGKKVPSAAPGKTQKLSLWRAPMD
jgi:hypothetical protein